MEEYWMWKLPRRQMLFLYNLYAQQANLLAPKYWIDDTLILPHLWYNMCALEDREGYNKTRFHIHHTNQTQVKRG